MFITKVNNNGTDYLKLVENVWPAGAAKPKKRVVLNIGPLKRFDDGLPDYIGRLRKSFKEGKPIIPMLQEFVAPLDERETEGVDYLIEKIPLQKETPIAAFRPLHIADIILNAYMEELGLARLFRQIKSERRIQYDLLGFVKLVVFGRILSPQSKWATVCDNSEYYSPILRPDFNPYNVYDMLDIVHENRHRIFRAMDNALRLRQTGRDTSIIFYDVTNFFFEIEENDEDVVEGGVVIEEGLRKRGHSKENRPQPIVQMGLFMDRDGVPIGVKSFPGNTVDNATLISAAAELVEPMGYGRFIYCADRGLCTMSNLARIVRQERGYLISKSIKKTKKEEREWIIEPEGYSIEKDADGEVAFKHKSRIMDRNVECEDGKKVFFQEKVVVFWSREYYKREQRMNESFSNFLKGLEDGSGTAKLSASQVNALHRFLKDEVVESLDPANDKNDGDEEKPGNEAEEKGTGNKGEAKKDPDAGQGAAEDQGGKQKTAGKGGEKQKKWRGKRLSQEEKEMREAERKAEAARRKSIKAARRKHLDEEMKDPATARKMIDWEKVNQWRDYAGYYQIVTSETKENDLEVIRKYRLLTQIENRFRTMKGTLDTRPVYVSDPNHIDAHLVLCVVALAIMCLIQGKVKAIQGSESGKKWETGMNPDRIQDALNKLKVEEYAAGIYRFEARDCDDKGSDLQKILDAHEIEIPSKFYTAREIKKLRGSVKVL